ncbi:MAG: HDOD domain-containing protein [Thermoleophilia bacterium]
MDELRERLVLELRERLVDQALSLPLGNQAALSKVAELAESGAEVDDIVSQALLDEGFVAMLLRLANSAASASVTSINDLNTAISRLGLSLVGCLAISAPSLRLLAAPSDGLEEPRRELHRHGVLTGIVARELAEGGKEGDRALAAGLVHNVGLSVLSLHAKSGFKKLMAAAEQGDRLADVEAKLFGFTHAEVGTILAQAWQYPEELVAAIRDHDAPIPSSRLAAIVQIADLLVRERGIGIEARGEISGAALEVAGIARVDALEVGASLLDPGEDGQTPRHPLVAALETVA